MKKYLVTEEVDEFFGWVNKRREPVPSGARVLTRAEVEELILDSLVYRHHKVRKRLDEIFGDKE